MVVACEISTNIIFTQQWIQFAVKTMSGTVRSNWVNWIMAAYKDVVGAKQYELKGVTTKDLRRLVELFL